MTATATYRVKGTTDEVTECGLCGRTGLRKTVVLAVLDAAGNEEYPVYYGTDCASKVTGQRQAAITRAAAKADGEKAARLRWAREIIDAYGPVEGNVRATAQLYYSRNPHMRTRGVLASAEVAGLLAEARAALT